MQGHEDPRIDLTELKVHIVKKVGAERSRRYFYYLGRFLNHKVSKSEFDKSCHRLLGRENLPLHNKLIHSIMKNASLAKSPPSGQSGSNGVLLPKVAIRDRPSPMLLDQPHCRDDKGGNNRNMENGDSGPFGYHRPGKVVVAPLGIQFWAGKLGGARGTVPGLNRADFISCYDNGGLSETEMLRKRMESIAVAEGLGGVSQECSSTLNSILDVYLKKLITSCVSLSGARSMNGSKSLQIQTSNQPSDTTQEQHVLSLFDFRVAMELNQPQIGEDWSLLRERVLMRSFEEQEGV